MRRKRILSLMILLTIGITASHQTLWADNRTEKEEAVYLGVENYGAEETCKENRDHFLYCFETEEGSLTLKIDNGEKDENGKYEYPIQNRLKEGYRYLLTIDQDTVTDAEEIKGEEEPLFSPVVEGEPGERTLKNLLKTALEPVGTTLYIYGGGWDWQDEGSAPQARTLGVSSDWVRFFESQDSDFTYKEKDGDEAKADPTTSYYPYGEYNEYYYAGLDCSGYLGWVIYNTFETENGQDGYVGGATGFAKRLSEKEWGDWTQDVEVPDKENGYTMKPGDVMSINGHVWLSLGTCEDGSVVIAHSSPSKSRTGQPGAGVQISAVGPDEDCEAYRLADQYMSNYYPEWYERYPIYLCDPSVYFTFEGDQAGRFIWDAETGTGLADPEHLQEMKPAEVLECLYDGV